jgi:hypothetical protein
MEEGNGKFMQNGRMHLSRSLSGLGAGSCGSRTDGTHALLPQGIHPEGLPLGMGSGDLQPL